MTNLADILFIPFLLIITFNLKNLFRFNAEEKKLITIIVLFHTAVCIAAAPILFYGGDANHYWQGPKQMTFQYVWDLVNENPRPTQVMFFINHFFSHTLGMSFLSGMFLY